MPSTTTTSVKAYKGIGMEGRMAKWYATNTGKAMDEFKALAGRIARELPSESSVLEVAPGPGYFAIELAKLGGYRVTGLDISKTFVEIASRNAKDAKDAGVAVDFRQGRPACRSKRKASSLSFAALRLRISPTQKFVLKSLRNRAYTTKQFRDFFAQTGFHTAQIHEDPIGFEIRFRRA